MQADLTTLYDAMYNYMNRISLCKHSLAHSNFIQLNCIFGLSLMQCLFQRTLSVVVVVLVTHRTISLRVNISCLNRKYIPKYINIFAEQDVGTRVYYRIWVTAWRTLTNFICRLSCPIYTFKQKQLVILECT